MFNQIFSWFNKDRVILNQAKKNKSIVYGGQALKANMGFIARPTRDYDIFSNNPKRSARQLQSSLDKQAGGDYYYSKASKFHKGTHKVYYVGKDSKKGTKDDVGIADYTKIPRSRPKTNKVEGIDYVKLSETKKDKLRSLKDPKYKFRHYKDANDLHRINTFRKTFRREGFG